MFGNRYKLEVASLKQRIRYLETELDNQKLHNVKERNGNLLIDFSKLDVVSIERVPRNKTDVNDIWVTLITYRADEPNNGGFVKKNKEMYFFTDNGQHNKICLEYNDYVKSKEKKK
jgi:hypothetical protein